MELKSKNCYKINPFANVLGMHWQLFSDAFIQNFMKKLFFENYFPTHDAAASQQPIKCSA